MRTEPQRVTLDLAEAVRDGQVALRGSDGAELARIHSQHLRWECRGTILELRLFSTEPLGLPAPSDEQVVSALARVLQAVRGQGAVVMLANPAQALGEQRILLADGVRLVGIASDEDLACWDVMLAAGMPVYGARGVLAFALRKANPFEVLSALAYGLFTCEEGLSLTRLDEDRRGVGYAAPGPTTARVVVRGGFVATTLEGSSVRYDDRGNEVSVRLEISSADGRCWTQPRFVIPPKP